VNLRMLSIFISTFPRFEGRIGAPEFNS